MVSKYDLVFLIFKYNKDKSKPKQVHNILAKNYFSMTFSFSIIKFLAICAYELSKVNVNYGTFF